MSHQSTSAQNEPSAGDDTTPARRLGLGALWTPRFARYGVVGVLGIGVNLGALWVLSEVVGLHTNVAAALSIELSVLTNFVLNDAWTFADRREDTRLVARLAQYHLVTGVGAVIQWGVFVAANVAVFLAISDAVSVTTYAAGRDLVHAWLVGPVVDPPDVGALKYGSQLVGIGVAVVWNYLANLYWTWGARPPRPPSGAREGDHPDPSPAVAMNTLPAPSTR